MIDKTNVVGWLTKVSLYPLLVSWIVIFSSLLLFLLLFTFLFLPWKSVSCLPQVVHFEHFRVKVLTFLAIKTKSWWNLFKFKIPWSGYGLTQQVNSGLKIHLAKSHIPDPDTSSLNMPTIYIAGGQCRHSELRGLQLHTAVKQSRNSQSDAGLAAYHDTPLAHQKQLQVMWIFIG